MEKSNKMYPRPKLQVKKVGEFLEKDLLEGAVRRKKKSEPENIPWPITDLGYEIYDVIGRGGNAIVNLARCIENQKICAIKRVNLLPRSGLNTVISEVQVMSRLRHIHLASFSTSFIHSTELWIVLDYYYFGSMEDIMKREADSGSSELFCDKMIASFMKDMLKGLMYLHHHGFVHADIKPGNILLREDGNAVLADFGSARFVTDKSPGLVTTPVFRAPELASTQNLSAKADIWSLGMTAVNLSGEHVYNMVRSPRDLVKLYREFAKDSDLFHWVTTSCLAIEPRRRLNAWLHFEHRFFRKPMKKMTIVKRVSKIPLSYPSWKRQERPYIEYLPSQTFRRGRWQRRPEPSQESSSEGWILDTPNNSSNEHSMKN